MVARHGAENLEQLVNGFVKVAACIKLVVTSMPVLPEWATTLDTLFSVRGF